HSRLSVAHETTRLPRRRPRQRKFARLLRRRNNERKRRAGRTCRRSCTRRGKREPPSQRSVESSPVGATRQAAAIPNSGEAQPQALDTQAPVVALPGFAALDRPRIGDRAGGDDLAGGERREARLSSEHAHEMRERVERATEHVAAYTAVDAGAVARQRQLE